VFKKFLAALGTLALAAGMALAVAPAASATDSNNSDYWESLSGETCEDVGYSTEDSEENPYVLPEAPDGREWSRVIIKAGRTGHDGVTNENAQYTTGLTAGAEFVHPQKDSISHVIVCSIPLKDSVDCNVITFIKGSKLDGSNYINLTIIKDGKSFQMNAEINEVQAQDSDVASASGLYVLVKAPGGDVKYPLTIVERDSGVFKYYYSNYLTGEYTVDWIQYDSHNTHFEGELTCGEEVEDAAASVTVTPPTCVAAGSLTLNTPTWATWGSYTPAVGAYSVVATAEDGHTFPADTTPGVSITNGGKTKTFTGTILPADDQATDCDRYEVALYLYQKKDPTQPASWQNSLKQTFIASHKGTAWFTTFPTGLPDYVCGPAWGVQQDKVGNWAPEWDDNGNFVWPTNIEYPTDNIGWPPIYEAKHDDLSTVITVPACDTPTGEPKFEVKSCKVGSQNLVTLDAVLGGQWKVEQNGVVLDTYDSYTGTPAGFDEYTIRLVDKDPLDQYDVAAKSWTYTAVDPSTLTCATAEDPSWAEQVCNPDGVGFTTASYTITPATGVRYEISLDDGLTFTDATPAGNDSVKTEVTSFPTKIIIKAFALPGYELVGTSEFSHIFLASADDCIDKDASASIAYNTPTCLVAGTIDVANSTLVNATWKDALPTTPGDHTVVAKANTGHAFSNGDLEQSFAVKILPTKTGPECDPPTLGLLTPTAKATQPTCTAAGSYTLGGLEGAQFNWTINGSVTTVPNGTYEAPKGGGDIVLVAKPVNPTDGLQDWVNPVTLKFNAAPSAASCGDLPTLAFTGTGVSMQLTLVGALLGLAGIGFFFVGRRLRNGQ
jgi:hypothetical protein